MESLALARELGDRWSVAYLLENIARLAGSRDQARRAARLWGSADALRQVLGTPRPPGQQPTDEQAMAAVRATLGEEAFTAAYVVGHALPLGEAIALALEPATAN